MTKQEQQNAAFLGGIVGFVVVALFLLFMNMAFGQLNDSGFIKTKDFYPSMPAKDRIKDLNETYLNTTWVVTEKGSIVGDSMDFGDARRVIISGFKCKKVDADVYVCERAKKK